MMKQIPVPSNARVFVQHLRLYEGVPSLWTRYGAKHIGITSPPLAKGGLTLVQIEFANGTVARGSARCSVADNFEKAKGRVLATNRAMKIALKESRGAVWDGNLS